jgi:hypothetical protein
MTASDHVRVVLEDVASTLNAASNLLYSSVFRWQRLIMCGWFWRTWPLHWVAVTSARWLWPPPSSPWPRPPIWPLLVRGTDYEMRRHSLRYFYIKGLCSVFWYITKFFLHECIALGLNYCRTSAVYLYMKKCPIRASTDCLILLIVKDKKSIREVCLPHLEICKI